MDLKKYLFPWCTGIQLPTASPIASTPVASLAPEDIEVEFYAAMFLQAQGKLMSADELLAELENDAD